VPLLLSLSTWRGDIDRRSIEHSAKAISIAARFGALIAGQDAFLSEKLEHDRENAGASRIERAIGRAR
jgi:hypothetical protein